MGTAQMWRDFNWGIENHFDEYMKEELARNEFPRGTEPVVVMTEVARRTYQRIWDGLTIYWQQKHEWEDAQAERKFKFENMTAAEEDEFWAEAIKRHKEKGAKVPDDTQA
jgi:hypothetical protein